MYPETERRPARVVKLEHVQDLGRRQRIAVVVDDDPRVIELISSAGVPTQLATWRPWSPAMRP
jgi:hypothetical protein